MGQITEVGDNMPCIVENQKQEDAVLAGTAVRFAYNRAKTWKAGIWTITFIFAILQTGASAYIFSSSTLAFDMTPYVVFFLFTYVIAGSFGKPVIEEWQNTGCTLQRLHDFLVLQVGIKPTHIELPKAQIVELSNKRLSKVPGDEDVLQTWWPESLITVTFPVAKVISVYSTFSWEHELRKQYQKLLKLLLVMSVATPIILALFLGYTIPQTFIFTLAPFTPFISVVLDEWLANQKSLKITESLTRECHSTWVNIMEGKLSDDEIGRKTDQYMSLWQGFRQSATPIFEWLYKRSRNKMEINMMVNTDDLIQAFINK